MSRTKFHQQRDGRADDVSYSSDTVLFKSPTCTPRDKTDVEKLAKIAGVDPMNLHGLLKAKSNMSTKSAKDILMGDFKKFDFSGTKAGVGQSR